jgi:hypothetical protein
MSKIEKRCNACNIVKPINEFYRQYKTKHPEWNCYDSNCIPCRLEYGNKRRREFKKLAVEYKGGECVDCKLKTLDYCVYDFHHMIGNKEFSISATAKKFSSLQVELDKCILLCSNCHRIRHSH